MDRLLRKVPLWKNPDEDVWVGLWRAFVSEFCATLIFVFIGTGSVEAAQAQLGDSRIGPPALLLIAFAHGFAITVLIYSIGEISGGHINPVVTWAVLITKRISVTRALTYWAAQFSGAICGSAILRGLLPDSLIFGMGCHEVNPNLTPGQGLGCEFVFTFIFIFVVFATAISPFSGKVTP